MRKLHRGPAGQAGATAIGIFIILATVGMLVVAALKIAPALIEHHQLKSLLEGLSKESASASPKEIRDKIIKRLDVNMIRSVSQEQIDIERSGPNFKVTVNYEVRTPYMGPVDLVVHFTDEVEVPAR